MNRKVFISMFMALVLLISCEMQSVKDYVYLTESDGTKGEAALVFAYKGRLVTNAKDGYEENDSSNTAGEIAINIMQEHNFYDDASDWLYFTAEAGKDYIIESWVYDSADTKIYLYDSSINQLENNDDKGDGTYGSKISWTAPSAGT